MKKFKENLLKLVDSFETKEEMIDFLIKNKTFNEDFAQQIITCKDINNIKNKITINDIKNNIDYGVKYKKDKFTVDISKNKVFSYLDSEEELITKMDTFILSEEFENAEMLLKYLNTIEIVYINK